MLKLLLLMASLVLLVRPRVPDSCADPANASISLVGDLNERISSLERRLRALEQPVWMIRDDIGRWDGCAEGPCKCRPEMRSVSCSRLALTDLPALQQLPSNVLKLDLSYNHLMALHQDSFDGLNELNYLDINDNVIEFLPINLFFSLRNVTCLRLSKNLIRELDKNQFIRMKHLVILDLSRNKLRSLPNGLFSNNNGLVILDLSQNCIGNLGGSGFAGLSRLEELLIAKNRLSRLLVDCFFGLANLKRLSLEENQLSDLSPRLFSPLLGLEELNLRDNCLKAIPSELLQPLTRLRVLQLSNNQLTQVSPTSFRGLGSLRELQLGHNNLEKFVRGAFAGLGSLERLVIHANKLRLLDSSDLDGLANLTSLFLHSNHLRILHPACLKGTPRLRKLCVSPTNKTPDDDNNKPDRGSSQLEGNQLLRLPKGLFERAPGLARLRLGRNPWRCDCSALYLAAWLRRLHRRRQQLGNNLAWPQEFGAGAVCRGPDGLVGRLLANLTYFELCQREMASAKGIGPRIPVHLRRTEPPDDFLL